MRRTTRSNVRAFPSGLGYAGVATVPGWRPPMPLPAIPHKIRYVNLPSLAVLLAAVRGPSSSSDRVAMSPPLPDWVRTGCRAHPLGTDLDAFQHPAHHRKVAELQKDQGEDRRSGPLPGVAAFRRKIRRVRPPGCGSSFHAQVLSGFSHRSHWFGSNAFTLNAVVSLTFLAIGIQSPILGGWYSSRMRSALSWPALSSRA